MLDEAATKAFRQWHAKPGPRRELDLSIAFTLEGYSRTPTHLPDTILREFTN